MADAGRLKADVGRGLAWSATNNLSLRVAGLVVGVVLARLLTPEQFGIYAVGLTVQTVLMALADFGLSADLVRSVDPRRRAPTVASLGLVTGGTLTLVMCLSSGWLASALGSPDAAPVIAVLSWTLLLAGGGVVPFAMLLRRFEQKKLFVISAVDFVVGTTVTLTLFFLGAGVVALAIGRVVAQLSTLVLQFVLANERPRFSIDRAIVGSVIAFGVPVAAANLLSWGILGIDKVILVRMVGPVALGYYVLAFNISTWPMTAVGQVVRSVALPMFARIRGRYGGGTLACALAPTWTLALTGAAMLAALSGPLIEVVYGAKWLPAAQLLPPLAVFGAVRVAFDLVVSYLYARGYSLATMWVQVLWLVCLIGALVSGVSWLGMLGAAYAHLAVSVFIVVPAYLYILRVDRCDVTQLAKAAVTPVPIAVVVGFTAHLVASVVDHPVGALAAGIAAGLLVFVFVGMMWTRARVRELRAHLDDVSARPSPAAEPGQHRRSRSLHHRPRGGSRGHRRTRGRNVAARPLEESV